MTRTTDDKLLQEIQDLAEARQAAERYEEPMEFGRRMPVEIFEKYVKKPDSQESSTSPTD